MNTITSHEHLLHASRNDLLLQIGSDIVRARRYAKAPNEATLLDKAERWWRSSRRKVQMAVCTNTSVHAALNAPDVNRRILLMTAIVDVISDQFSPISPWTVAAMIVQEGLIEFCEHFDKPND